MPRLTYRIAMPKPHTHLYEVSVTLAQAAQETTFRMPGWTPGSYLVREYCRHVQEVTAVDSAGNALACEHVSKAAWTVTQGADGEDVTLSYKVYAHALTVRTSHLTGSHGYFNGANVFMCPDGCSGEGSELEVVPFGDWTVSVGLPPVPGSDGFRFAVADFDQLVDSPVECGSHTEIEFEAAGTTHRWAVWGPGAQAWHGELGTKALADVTALIEAEVALFGDLPADVDNYLFIVHLLPTRGGGLEHKNSQTIGVSSDALRDPKAYEEFLTLVAHEYFHVWNVKRIRAQGLGPFDYSKEAHTPLLWMMEGITAWYDTIITVRAGLITPKRYLEMIGERLASCRAVPGRRIRSLEQSSFDAWVKLYRRDENTDNTAVSYYLKGELAIMCMDLHLRRVTGGERSFDDVMRALWTRQKETGAAISPAEVLGLLEAATGVDLTEQLEAWVAGVEDLPLEAALEELGLTVKASWKAQRDAAPFTSDGEEDGAAGDSKTPTPWLGLTTTQDTKGRTVVAKVRSDSPAGTADVYPGDELVAIEGRRVGSDWADRLKVFEPGDEVTLLLFRRSTLQSAIVALGERPPEGFDITLGDNSSDDTKARLSAWLGDAAGTLWAQGKDKG